MYVTARHNGQELALDLTGEWRALRLPAIESALAGIELAGVRRVIVSTRELKALDLSASWRLREFLEQARASGSEVKFDGEAPDQLRLIGEALAGGQVGPPAPEHSMLLTAEPVEAIGRHAVRRWQETLTGLAFFGRLCIATLQALTNPRRLRPAAVARHIYDTGITAIPIVSLIAFLISVIIAYMSAQQLQDFGAEIFVVDLVTIGVLRELGVLLTAIIVAGRSGSSFAAEIGAMRLNEEVDALQASGIDSFAVLVVPRVIGLIVALPLLTFVADAIGLTGGALLCHWLLDMPIWQYLARVDESIGPTTFWVGIIKAPVFALLIALAGTMRGLQVRGSSRELGRLTTVAVVQAIFLVIFADAMFAVLFMELDI